jgi:hypothetical protein
MKKKISLLAAVFCGVMQLSVSAASLSVDPVSIHWNEQRWVNLEISGLTPGETVQFRLFADIDGDHTIGTSDALIWAHEMTDGAESAFLDEFGLGDRDGLANGVLEVRISYFGTESSLFHFAGSYIWTAITSGGPVSSDFSVTQPVSSYQISGTVIDFATTHAPLGAAAVMLEWFSDETGPRLNVWADETGAFSVCLPASLAPSSLKSIRAMSLGCLDNDTGPEDEPFSTHCFQSAITSGVNTLASPLYVASAIEPLLTTVQGQVVLDDGSNTPLPGVTVIAEWDEADSGSVAVTDTNGIFSLTVLKEENQRLEIFTGTYDLNLREIISTGFEISGAITGPITTNIICHVPNALARGVVTNAVDGTPVMGMDVFFENANEGIWGICATESNGAFEVCVKQASNWIAGVEEDSARMQGFVPPPEHRHLFIDAPLYTATHFGLQRGYLVSGTVYNYTSNTVFGGDAYLQETSGGGWLANMAARFDGTYSLLMTNGSYTVGVENFAGYVAASTNVLIDGADVTNVDFYLNPAAQICGTVLADGLPYSECNVDIAQKIVDPWGSTFEWIASGRPEIDGTFSVDVPPGSNYVAVVWPWPGEIYLWEMYDSANNMLAAQLLTAGLDSPQTNVNFDLEQGAVVNGTLLCGGSPVHDCQLVAYIDEGDSSYLFRHGSVDDDTGAYSVTVPAGQYLIHADGPGGQNWISEFYNQASIPTEADRFILSVGQVTNGIDFNLVQGARFSGSVHDPIGNPLSAGICFFVNDAGTNLLAGSTWSSFDGSFSAVLPGGTSYLAQALRDWDGFLPSWFSNSYSAAGAVWLPAFPGSETSGLDFTLQPGFNIGGQVREQHSNAAITTATVNVVGTIDFSQAVNVYGSGYYAVLVPTNQSVILQVNAPGYAGEYYDNTFDPDGATALTGGYVEYLWADFTLYSLVSDMDGDTLPDYQEDTVPDGIFISFVDQSDFNASDSDGDGQNDYEEGVITGTDPLDPFSYFRLYGIGYHSSPDRAVVFWSTEAGREYDVYWTSNLLNGFTQIATNAFNGLYHDYTHGPGARGFYKVKVRAPTE